MTNNGVQRHGVRLIIAWTASYNGVMRPEACKIKVDSHVHTYGPFIKAPHGPFKRLPRYSAPDITYSIFLKDQVIHSNDRPTAAGGCLVREWVTPYWSLDLLQPDITLLQVP